MIRLLWQAAEVHPNPDDVPVLTGDAPDDLLLAIHRDAGDYHMTVDGPLLKSGPAAVFSILTPRAFVEALEPKP